MTHNIRQHFNQLIHNALGQRKKAKNRFKQRMHYQKYKLDYVRFRLNEEERQFWKNEAVKNKESLSGIIKKSAKAYRQQRFLLPKNLETRLDDLKYLLQNCTCNINQMARYAHTVRNKVDLNGMIKEVTKLKNLIVNFVSNPPLDVSKDNSEKRQ